MRNELCFNTERYARTKYAARSSHRLSAAKTLQNAGARKTMPWVIKDAPFIDDWSERDYQTLIACLKHTVEAGGFVYAAFCDGLLKALFPLSPSCLAARNNTLICQAFMFPRINAARASAKRFFWRLGHGPERRERGSCTSPRIPLLKARRFTGPWAVLRRGYTIKRMLRRSPMIASWNAACK